MTPANMPWVCGAAFGRPVEPEVNRYLATVAWLTPSRAASTAGVGSVSVSSESGMVPSPPSTVTNTRSGFSAFRVSKARANSAELCANTTFGRTVAKQCFSLAWSDDSRE